MDLKYTSEEVENALVIKMENEIINFEITPELKEALLLNISGGSHNIILDMSRVRQMDSSAIGAMMFGKRQANNMDGDLCLVALAEPIREIMRIAQLSRVFNMFDTIDEAIAFFHEELN